MRQNARIHGVTYRRMVYNGGLLLLAVLNFTALQPMADDVEHLYAL
jgi:hypothetical protein